MNKSNRQKKISGAIYAWSAVGAAAGWLACLGIVLSESTPTYVRWPVALLMVCSAIIFHHDHVKN